MTAQAHRYEVTESALAYEGRIISVRRDQVRMPEGDVSQRDVVVHPGAVGVVALDDGGRVVMVHQYRHPVGGPLWELPAGILDVAGEPRRPSPRPGSSPRRPGCAPTGTTCSSTSGPRRG